MPTPPGPGVPNLNKNPLLPHPSWNSPVVTKLTDPPNSIPWSPKSITTPALAVARLAPALTPVNHSLPFRSYPRNKFAVPTSTTPFKPIPYSSPIPIEPVVLNTENLPNKPYLALSPFSF